MRDESRNSEGSKMRTQVIGHRGAAAYYPENTMASFEAAIKMGVDAIELDVHRSADGKIVVLHDETLERTTNGRGYVHQMTYKQLQTLDAGTLHPGHSNMRIPLLEDVLMLAKDSDVWTNIEIKAGSVPYPNMEKSLAEIVHMCGMQKRILFSSFNHYALLKIRQVWPEAPVAVLHVSALVDAWEYAGKLGAKAVHPLYAVTRIPGWVKACQNAGIAVNAWTVDDEAVMGELMRLPVDGLVSNRPDVALRVRARMGSPE